MIENLIKDLQENKIKNIYYFYGNEKFLIDYYLNKLQEAVIPEKIEGINFDYFTYKEVNLSLILNSANTVSFMGENKFLIIRESELISKEKQLPAHAIKALEEYLLDPNPTSFVIFLGEEELKGLAKNKVAGLLKKSPYCRLIEFKKLKGFELKRWVKENLKLRNLQASDEVVDILVLIGERGLYNLQNELDKLSLGSNGGKLTKSEADELISYTPEGRIFELVDAVIAKNGKRAINLLEEYFTANEPPILLRSMLVSSFRRLIVIKEALDAGYVKGVFKDYLDTSSDYLIDKSIKQVRKASLQQLLDVYEELYKLEFLSRSSKQDQKTLIKDLIVRIAF